MSLIFLSIFKGRIEKKLTEDVRGTRYRIEGPPQDGRLIHDKDIARIVAIPQ